MKLIYRAQTFDYEPRAYTYQPPRALNWRFQTTGMIGINSEAPSTSYQKPRALNWRYLSDS